MSTRIAASVVFALAAALAPPPSAAQAAGTQSPKPATPAAAGPAAATASSALKPGQFLWMPELSPQGPVVVVVSLPEQRAHVYRNGVRIGVSTISSGMRGFETQTGVYPILERETEHYSNLYDNAPMPYMLRLTWSGTALHAGRIPGYPASHGCIRLPKPFAQALFDTVRRGTVVVIADDASHPPAVVSPGWVSPVDPTTGAVFGLARTAATEAAPDVPAPDEQAPASSDLWAPERAPEGPLSLLLSRRDRQLAVLRNGIEIGRAQVALTGEPADGTRAHTLHVETSAVDTGVADPAPESRWVSSDAIKPPPPIPTLYWRAIAQPGKAARPGTAQPPLRAGTLRFDDDFARQLLPLLSAETTLAITDEALPPPRAITPPPTGPSTLPAPAGPLPAPPQNATPVTPTPPSPVQLPPSAR
jgi:lipoprotein-anchoring transpeptidase ErfK/SrfK